MSKLACLLLVLAALSTGGVAVAAEQNLRMEPAPVNRLDQESLQRGARNFANYCMGCHSAKYMRYNRLNDIGLTDTQITDNLIFTGAKIGDTMEIAMREADAKNWFGAAPPDLSVEARVRGPEWLYNYLLGFYRDDSSKTGWNNLVFPKVAMPNVLWQLSGTNTLQEKEYEEFEKAQAASIGNLGISQIEPAGHGKYVVRTLAQSAPGDMSPENYRAFVADLVNYLDYIAEPARNDRIRLGIIVMMFLGVMFILAWWTKREFWKDVH